MFDCWNVLNLMSPLKQFLFISGTVLGSMIWIYCFFKVMDWIWEDYHKK